MPQLVIQERLPPPGHSRLPKQCTALCMFGTRHGPDRVPDARYRIEHGGGISERIIEFNGVSARRCTEWWGGRSSAAAAGGRWEEIYRESGLSHAREKV